MASISKRKWRSPEGEAKLAYQVRYKKLDGSIARRQFDKRKDAEEFRRKVEPQEPKKAHLRECYTTAKTVAEGFDEFLRALQQGADGKLPVEPSTLKAYRAKVEAHLIPMFGTYALAEMNPRLCGTLRDQIVARLSDRRYASHVWALFCRMIRFMEGRGAIASNPTANVRIHFSKSKPSDEGEEEAGNIPTVDEARKILTFCKEQASSPNKRQRRRWKKWHAMILLGFETGMRIGEIIGLSWSCVQLDRRIIQVRQTAKLNMYVIGKTKTPRSKRDVGISETLANMLREWKESCPAGEHNLVFPAFNGGLLKYTSFRTCVWNKIMTELGLVDNGQMRYTAHSMRHFKASVGLSKPGTSALEVSRELGHAKIQTTFDIYGHLIKGLSESGSAERASDIHSLISAAP